MAKPIDVLILINDRLHILATDNLTLCRIKLPREGKARMNSLDTDCPHCKCLYEEYKAELIENIEPFKAELITLYEKYGLSIGHEDNQGAFIIEKLSTENIEWIQDALEEV